MRRHWIALLLAVVILPREAAVFQTGKDGAEWSQTGEIGLPFGTACRRMETELDRGGWKVKDWFSMTGRKKVTVWEKGGERISLLMWEKELRKSGFSWGVVKKADEKAGNGYGGRKE